jgi:hypothetical protein
MAIISQYQKRAKKFADTHGYKLRKLKEGKIKVTRPDGSTAEAVDYPSAHELMMREVYRNGSKKNIFDMS